jgi:hypothetical protein
MVPALLPMPTSLFLVILSSKNSKYPFDNIFTDHLHHPSTPYHPYRQSSTMKKQSSTEPGANLNWVNRPLPPLPDISEEDMFADAMEDNNTETREDAEGEVSSCAGWCCPLGGGGD